MFSDGLKLVEGSSIINAVVAGGASLPDAPSFGELFYRTDTNALFIYNGEWVRLQEYDPGLSAILELEGDFGFLKKIDADTWQLDTNVYLTQNQTITLSGDVSGSGSTSISTTLATVNSNIGSFGSTTQIPILTVDGKGRITAISNSASIAATTAQTLATTRSIALSGAATGTATSFNGSSNIVIPVTALNADNLSSGTVPSARLSGSYGISITGNAATASTLASARTISISGDATWSTSFDGSANAAGTLTLASVAAAGTYGSSSSYPVITIDAKGRAITITTVSLGTMAFQNANAVAISGGTVSGITINSSSIGATTQSSGAFTTLAASQTTVLSGVSDQLRIRGAAATNRQISFDTNTISRWLFRTDSDAETGSNVGSNFDLLSVSDNGAVETLVLSIPRTSNIVDFKFTPTINGVSVATTAGNVSTADKWSTARTLSLTGDGTASLVVDGSTNVSSALTLATVNSNVGSFGSATAVPAITVNAKGLITAVASTNISIPSSQVNNFTESVQDVVSAFVVNGGGITATYNDTANTLTLGSTATSNNTAGAIVARNASGDFSAGSITLSGGLYLPTNNSFINIGSTTVVGSPLLKFHSSGNAIDYDSRIFATSGNSTIGNGTITIEASNITLDGSTRVVGGVGNSDYTYLALQPSDFAIGISRLQIKTTSLNDWDLSLTDGSSTVGNLSISSQTANITGSWTFNSPVNVAEPTLNSHATTKLYVDQSIDNAITGLDTKQSVRVATTGAITLSGLQTIDGVNVVAGDRVLVKNQDNNVDNGIYVVSASGWSRSADANASAEVTAGLYTFVTSGSQNANSGWVLIAADPITVGVTGLTFTQFNGLGQVTAGAGLTKTGNQIDAIGTSGRIVVNADSIDLATAGTAGTYRSVTTDAYGRVTSGSNPTTIAGYGLTDATQRAQNNFLSGTSVGSIRADDVRTLSNPSSGIGFTKGMRVRFSALEDNNLEPYADVIDLSTWTDSSGGAVNSLYFSKSTQLIYHKFALAAATAWTTKTLAYTDSTVSSANTLATARSISATGDATWSVTFDGSANVTSSLTLATVNASPQSNAFKRVTVNAKGLVTALSDVTSSDITAALGFTPVNKAGDIMSGNLEISTASGNAEFVIHKTNIEGNKSQVVFATNNLSVWDISSAAIADAFVINRYDNAGTFVGPVLSADRQTGMVTIPSITGALTGNASTSTALQTSRSISATGDATWTVNFDGSANATSTLTLSTVNSNVGSFGSSSTIPVVTVDAKGRVTAISSTAIAIPGSDLYYFDESFNNSGINSVIPVASIFANNLAFTDIDVAFSPRGQGAKLAQVPDGTSTGGNKRGIAAVDLQSTRTNAAHVASGNYATIAGGQSNTASGINSFAVGSNNSADGDYSVATGFAANSRQRHGAVVHSAGSFSESGDAQVATYIARAQTTSSIETVLTLNGAVANSTNLLVVPNNATVFFEIWLVARRADLDGESASWKISGCIDKAATAGSVAMIGAPNVQLVARDSSAWTTLVDADTVNGALRIKVIGENGKTIRWVAKIDTVEVIG